MLRLPKGPPPADIERVDRAGTMDVLVRDGARDVLIVGIGSMAAVSVEVAARLADQGIGVTVVDPRWVKPWDRAVVDLARDHRLVVCVEDNGRVGGCGASLLQLLNDEQVDTPFRQHGIPSGVSRPCQAGCDSRAHRAHGPGARARHRRGRHRPGPARDAAGTLETTPGRPASMSRPRPTTASWTDPHHPGRLRLAALAAVLALLLALAGCGGDDPDDHVVGDGGSSKVSVADAKAQEQRILNQRARAVRERDLGAVPAKGRPPRRGADGAAAAVLPQPRPAAARRGSPTGSPTSSGRDVAAPETLGRRRPRPAGRR